MTPTFFCICEEEWCWCTNTVPTNDTPCDACSEGVHIMEPPTQ